MSQQVDRYGNPLLAGGLAYDTIIDSTYVPLRQRANLLIDSTLSATDNDAQNGTTLSVVLGGANAVAQAEALGMEIPTAGANLTDADASIDIAGKAVRVLPAATLTANRVLTLATTGSPVVGETITVFRRDVTTKTYTVKDDAASSLIVLPASTRFSATFIWGGTHYTLLSATRIQ